MPPKLELLVSALDLIAFFLVTPIVIGEDRIVGWYEGAGRAVYWLRTVWFDRDMAPLTWASLVTMLVLSVLLVLVLLGVEVPGYAAALVQFGVAVVPAAFVILFGVVARLERRSTIFRALAIFGAVLFVAGKLIAMGSAYSRL